MSVGWSRRSAFVYIGSSLVFLFFSALEIPDDLHTRHAFEKWFNLAALPLGPINFLPGLLILRAVRRREAQWWLIHRAATGGAAVDPRTTKLVDTRNSR
jgi:cytochrome bd-type quinol oxidase subunit 2